MKSLITGLVILLLGAFTLLAQPRRHPNVIFILTDDMGYGDLSCLGGKYKTPNIDRLATQGRTFQNYYSAAPICSPSRVGVMTGMSPARWNITSFLQKKADNKLCEQADFLSTDAPFLARALKAGGYATGHFGKWHMGGGRDVDDAPSITHYGFDEYKSTWESPDPDPVITSTDWIWADSDSVKRWSRTAYFVDQTLKFLDTHKGKPCFINLWPDDVHTPWVGGDDEHGKYPGGPNDEVSFVFVLTEFDKQIGRLIDGLEARGLDNNTIVIFTSDNGPMPDFDHARSAGFRGSKLSLYEGGIRMPFIIRWSGTIPSGTVDSTSVISAVDLFRSICALSGGTYPRRYTSDGEDVSKVLLGKPASRNTALYWEYGRNEQSFRYPSGRDRSPSLAIRRDKWKLLSDRDGAHVELYDMHADKWETTNLAEKNPAITRELREKLLNWAQIVYAH
ncbi:sulfatase-like hydrolase/transferase [Chryseolinea sp. T2]|uniref:sulfatase family protein n=1 Tax=Chryseolinea sp. T2 TaxID=3129255 RepID=UPI003078720E